MLLTHSGVNDRYVFSNVPVWCGGTLDPEYACMAGLFPEGLLTSTDAILDTFERELAGLVRQTTRRSSASWNASSWP